MATKSYKGKAATAYLESMLGVPNRLPPPDDVMETAFARLADELEEQAAVESEKRLALLSVMLPYHINRLQRFLKVLERRGTPQSLEAADYIKGELKTAQDWREEIKANK